MEELTDAAHFVISREGIEFSEGSFDKTRFGRKVAWQSNSSHATTVFF